MPFRLCVVLLVFVATTYAQIVVIQGSDTITASRTTINNNFAWLDANKATSSHTHTGVYAPLAHVHIVADITGLQTALDGKASTSHTHTGVYAPLAHVHLIADITGLQAALDAKAATAHVHAAADTTSGTFGDARISQSSVTQHQAALSIATTQLTGSVTDAQVPNTITIDTATALAVNPTPCGAGQFVTDIAANGTLTCSTPAGGGDVTGPASSTNGNLPSFSGTTGKVLQDSGILASDVSGHIASTSNPHSVTKTQVGLGNVPNTDATARANHTGTQLAATISDFNTAVGATNAGTATALSANGANCSANQAAGGVSAAGAAEACIDLPATYQPLDADLTAVAGLAATAGMLSRTGAGSFSARTITGTANQITVTNGDGAAGNPTLSIPSSPTLPGTTTGTFSGNLTGNVTGNASTSTALAANGANCSAGQAPLGVDASGAVEGCFTPGGGHTQNTDTGTTSTTFQIDSDNTGPKLVNDSGGLSIRTSADAVMATISTAGVLTLGDGTAPWNLTGLTDDVAPSAPGTANEFTTYVDRTTGLWAYILNGGTVKHPALGKWATFTGPTAARTYTLPDADKTLMATDTAVQASQLAVVPCSVHVAFTGAEIANAKTAIGLTPNACNLTSYEIRSDATVSATFGVTKSTYAEWSGTKNSLVGAGTAPVIAGANKAQDTNLSDNSWTSLALAANDTIEISLSGVTVGSATKLVLMLKGTR
jgi:hypothetical protein